MVKIKSKSEPWNLYHNGNEVEEFLKERIFPDNYAIDDDGGIYLTKSDGHFYPVSHPDLSTQPSILPQRFGTYRMYEVLIPGVVNGRAITRLHYDQIPASATIVSAVAFNRDKQNAVSTSRIDGGWSFSVAFTPDFLLVRYFDSERDVYYGSGECGSGNEADEETDEAYWRYYEPNDETYLVNSNGRILVLLFGNSPYAVKKDGDNIALIVVSQWYGSIESDWGMKGVDCGDDTSHFAINLAPNVSYECYSGGSINPEPSVFE